MTVLKVNNYGAELQSYALPKALNDLGYDSENIDYLYYKHRDYIPLKQSKPMIRIPVKDRIKRKILILLEKTDWLLNRKTLTAKQKKFDHFHSTLNRLSKRTYRSIDELYNEKFGYDVFMAGSDQVWNPATLTSLKPYFLTFAPRNKKKISYASSFGVSDIRKEDQAIYTACLNNLDFLSCREKQGVEIIKQLTGRDATQVLDPTLLLKKEDWEKISIRPKTSEPYILLYILTHSPYIIRLARHISRITGYRIVRICPGPVYLDKSADVRAVVDAGPLEFLGWFSGASMILTNSFHGTTFSVTFQKPFFTITPKSKSNNSRQQNFLELLELSERLLREGSAFPSKEQLNCDFSRAGEILNEERTRSVDFLTNALDTEAARRTLNTPYQETSGIQKKQVIPTAHNGKNLLR
ncbi:MAG: polysaccharide pyruvyl transferase family protein [Prolixibacteraceae bacterium]